MSTAVISDAEAGARNRPHDLFVTAASLRPRRAPKLQAEAAAFAEVSKVLVDDPSLALRHLLKVARRLSGAGTAGLSLLRRDDHGETIVRWEAVSGALARREGTDTPRHCSPCGLCLDAGTTILVSRPERAFTWLHGTRPSIIEDLIAPLYDNTSNPLGTLWIAHHHGTAHFCSDDARILEQLAMQLVPALKLREHAYERRRAPALVASLQRAQQNLLAYDLHRERSLREQVENESRRALAFKDAMIHEVNHRTKNTLQAAATLLSLHARATPSAEARQALLDSRGRLQLLAKVHELLCLNVDNTQTVLMSCLFETLGDALQAAFAGAAARVRLEIMSDPMALPVDDAIPLALLANEAVTNAYKHAFPGESSGKITVHLVGSTGGNLTLRISDDGTGLHPSGGDGGMGFKLLRILAAQLRGALEFGTQAGTKGTVITLTTRPPVQRGLSLEEGYANAQTAVAAGR